MKTTCWLSIGLVMGLVFCLTGVALGEDWPEFRGPERNGVSKETGLLKSWPAEGPTLLWTATGCGMGWSSAAIADGTIYIAGDVGNNCQVMALGLDGKEKWRKAIGRAGDHRQYPGARSTPTVDGDKVYCLGPMGDLTCLNTKDGNVQWTVNIVERFGGRPPAWLYSESVLIDGDNVICTPGGRDATLAALNKKTGATVWTSKGLSDPAGYASPIVFKVGAGKIISTLTARGVVGVSATNGGFLWRYDRPANGTANCPSPVFYKDSVFCASGYNTGGGLVQVSVSRTGSSIRQVWETGDLVNHHGGYVVVDDHIYGYSDRGGWSCLKFASGERTYAERGVGKGSVIAADGMLYCLSEGRTVGLVKINPARYELVSQFRLPTRGRYPSWAHPSIANGRLYLRDEDSLMCYDIKAK